MKGPLAVSLARFSRWGHDHARGWLILVFLAFLGAFEVVALPGMQDAAGRQVPDAQLFHAPEALFGAVDSWGEEGRVRLRRLYLTVDIVHPVLYVLTFVLTISWLFQRCFDRQSSARFLNMIPCGAGAFDVLENLCMVILISAHPSQPRAVAWLAAGSTWSKWSFLIATAMLIVFGLVSATRARFRRRW